MERETAGEMTAYIASMVSIASVIPQAYMVYKTGNTDGLSMASQMLAIAGLVCWMVTAILTKSIPTFANSFVGITLGSYIVYRIYKERGGWGELKKLKKVHKIGVAKAFKPPPGHRK